MKKSSKIEGEKPQDEKFPLPVYPADEDIYTKEKEIKLEDEDEPGIKKLKTKNKLGEDLDVPGSELDDAEEFIGEEDEENNYYSLGGDDHIDLEEEDIEEDR
jgi:hypothetical protein